MGRAARAKAPQQAPPAAAGGDGESGAVPAEVHAWLEGGRDALLEEVARLSAAKPPDKKAVAEARARLAALATRGADTSGVSFAGAALHGAYYDAKFVRRGALLYRAVLACVDPAACAAAPLLAAQLTAAGAAPRRRLRVASLGGGPGTDVAGLFWAERHALRFGARRTPFHGPPPDAAAAPEPPGGLDVTLYDLERSWRRYLPALQRLMAPRIVLDFQPCDVRAPLPPPSPDADVSELGDGCNKALAAAAGGTHLFVLSYVTHETADAAAASDYAFYRSLARAAPTGAVFIFLDVRGYAARVFDAIHDAMAAAAASAESSESDAFVLVRFALAPPGGPLPAEAMVLLKRSPEAAPAEAPEEECVADVAEAVQVFADVAAAELAAAALASDG